ncbi:uncharacterized protein LOC143627997 [Bidens hawaiensis]|uniref:uncharacterized protein LOC143627997 n=1 Tax=Bidens hawaiensis TaxID=980011 RepID=UPI0040491658
MAKIENEAGTSSSQEQSTSLNEVWYMDSGCSRHMTCDKRSLVNYEEKFEGPVAFGSDENGGKIVGKGILTNGKVTFDNVFYVEGLQYNLLSIYQMCDKGYKVGFDDSHCFILRPEYVIPPDMIMMIAPRNGNLYELNMKDAVSRGGTWFVSKATENESKLYMADEDQLTYPFEHKHNMCALLQITPDNEEVASIIRWLQRSNFSFALTENPVIYRNHSLDFWMSARLFDDVNGRRTMPQWRTKR